ncbi:MAG: hypothetical protein OEW25_06605, partial [Nitrospira sp.]|nr:hypothetical protein [Nitrospira sp.]
SRSVVLFAPYRRRPFAIQLRIPTRPETCRQRQDLPLRERDPDLCRDRRGLRIAGIAREVDQPLRKE